jgi:hypothetical protein
MSGTCRRTNRFRHGARHPRRPVLPLRAARCERSKGLRSAGRTAPEAGKPLVPAQATPLREREGQALQAAVLAFAPTTLLAGPDEAATLGIGSCREVFNIVMARPTHARKIACIPSSSSSNFRMLCGQATRS